MSLLRADTDVVDIDFEVWDRTMAVTLRGYLASMKHALPLMLSRGGGAIVNMSSAAAFIGEPTRPAYATAKAGIGALTRHVASRWGRRGSGATRWPRASPARTRCARRRSGRTWRRPPCADAFDPGGLPRRHRRTGHVPDVRRRRLGQRSGDQHRRRRGPALTLSALSQKPRRSPLELLYVVSESTGREVGIGSRTAHLYLAVTSHPATDYSEGNTGETSSRGRCRRSRLQHVADGLLRQQQQRQGHRIGDRILVRQCHGGKRGTTSVKVEETTCPAWTPAR